jgi:hypothetical protein
MDIRTLSITSNDAAFLSGAGDSAILWDFQTLMPINRFVDESVRDITASLFVAGDKQFVVGTKVRLYLLALKTFILEWRLVFVRCSEL